MGFWIESAQLIGSLTAQPAMQSPRYLAEPLELQRNATWLLCKTNFCYDASQHKDIDACFNNVFDPWPHNAFYKPAAEGFAILQADLLVCGNQAHIAMHDLLWDVAY